MLKKTLFVVLVSMLMFSIVLAGCSSETDGEHSSNGEDRSEPVQISVFAPQDADTDLETNSFTQYVEEEFNIEFKWETTSHDSSAANERRQISLASGDFPDLYLLIPWVDLFSQSDLHTYGEQGAIIPLNDLIEEHAPNIQAALDNHPDYRAMATAPDGNIYGLPQLNDCYHCTWSYKYWINTAWLDELDLDMPATHEEFKDVLIAFRTEDPNGNGEADEIPLSGSVNLSHTSIIPFLMNGFIYDDGETRLLLRDGEVDFAANKEEWREGLEYIHSLYEEGLIDPGAFTQNQDAYQQLGDNADAQILGVGAAEHPAIFVSDEEYTKSYDVLAPLSGPHADYAGYNYPSTPGATFVLTHEASEEAQVAAMKMLDYMYTEEGQIRAHFGEEDLDWRKPQEGDVAIQEDVEPILKQIPTEADEDPRNSSWGAMAQYYQPREFRDGWVQDVEIYTPEGYERRLQEATQLYEGHEPGEVFPHWAIWIDPTLSEEFSMLETNINDYVEQSSVQFITGERDLNQEWDEYVQGLEQLGLERYLEIMQEAYDNSIIE